MIKYNNPIKMSKKDLRVAKEILSKYKKLFFAIGKL